MNLHRLVLSSCGLVLSAFAIAACGDDQDEADSPAAESGGGTLTVYSSLPLQGAARPQSTALVNGMRLAIKEAKGKAGSRSVKYQSLDDSTAQAGAWTPEAVSQNARKAAQDSSTAVYLGEFNSGASAVSIPILSDAKVPQISPANTAVGLTSDGPGADKGEPAKYYQSGFRNYVRIVPKDTIQGAALATVMKEDGCKKVAMANDKEVYGAGLARNITTSAKEQGFDILFNEGVDTKAPNYRSLASRAKARGADCFIFSGITSNNGVQIFKDFEAALPDAKLFGPDGVAETSFFDPKEGGIPASVAGKVKVTVAKLDPDSYPPEGREFFAAFEREYKDANPDPYAIYGYEAMQLALDAIERSESGKKEDIVKALFETKERPSVLGTYSIDENGDTTLTDYGVYTIKGGELEFDKTIKTAEAAEEAGEAGEAE